MPITVELSQYPEELNVRGFETICIKNKGLCWLVGCIHFEEIHGISRVVDMIPEKVVTSMIIHQEYPKGDPFLLKLALELLYHYERLAKSKHFEVHIGTRKDPLRVVLNIDGPGQDQVNCRAHFEVGILGSICWLINSIENLVTLLECDNKDGYWSKAKELIDFGDTIREQCTVYLSFAHRVTIVSRRRPLNEETTERLVRFVTGLLRTKKDHLKHQFVQEVGNNM